MNIENQKIVDMCDEIHARNVVAGWWSDLKTGQNILATRNRPELMMLVVSEVSEADHGIQNNLNDDKLPHLPMFNVELADVAIRLFDMIGAEASLYGSHLYYDYAKTFNQTLDDLYDLQPEKYFMAIINTISAAMEHIRKGRIDEYRLKLSEAQAITFAVAELEGIDLFSVIQEKLDFNKNRADHKIENRILSDGKKF